MYDVRDIDLHRADVRSVGMTASVGEGLVDVERMMRVERRDVVGV